MIAVLHKNYTLWLILLTLFGAILHFYNLNWGAPYYFHPDERNVASAISQLSYPDQMNPHFFAYGSLPIYLVYFTGLFMNILTQTDTTSVHFERAIMIGRFFSATMATLLIPILFLLGKRLRDEKTGLFVAFLGTMSVGLIQFAHFGTFEMWLTFFTVLLFWACLQKINRQTLFFLGSLFGILVATKISSLALFPLPLLAIQMHNLSHQPKHTKKIVRIIHILGLAIAQSLFLLSIAALVYMATNPFVFFDTDSFISSMKYESEVGLGTMPVFYTEEFTRSIPVLFQFQNVYPFLINPILTIMLLPAFILLLWQALRKIWPVSALPQQTRGEILLLAFYTILFLSQAVLFVKWTRYLMPTLPFIYLIIGLALFKPKWPKYVLPTFIVIICTSSTIFALSYFITAFVQPDSRLTARNFAKEQLAPDDKILSEMYDLGITPFNGTFANITLYNFYDLDHPSVDWTTFSLQNNLQESDVIILPSQRLIKSRMTNTKDYPKGHDFYENLLAGRTNFQKIYETPCDIFCQITYLNNPLYQYEQTANIFDRPTVMIFKKMN